MINAPVTIARVNAIFFSDLKFLLIWEFFSSNVFRTLGIVPESLLNVDDVNVVDKEMDDSAYFLNSNEAPFDFLKFMAI